MSEREKCLEGCKARQLIEPDAHAPSCPNAQPATTPPDDTARLDWLEKHGQRLRRSRMGKPWRAIALANALQDDGPASRPCETAREAIDWMRRDGDHCPDCDSTHSHDPWCSHNLKALPPPPEQDGDEEVVRRFFAQVPDPPEYIAELGDAFERLMAQKREAEGKNTYVEALKAERDAAADALVGALAQAEVDATVAAAHMREYQEENAELRNEITGDNLGHLQRAKNAETRAEAAEARVRELEEARVRDTLDSAWVAATEDADTRKLAAVRDFVGDDKNFQQAPMSDSVTTFQVLQWMQGKLREIAGEGE